MGEKIKKENTIVSKAIILIKNIIIHFIFFFTIGTLQLMTKIFPKYGNFIQIIIALSYVFYIGYLVLRMKETNYIDRIFKFTVIIVINSPLLIYSIVMFLHTYPDLFIKVSNSSTWISFAGSIIGGSMTMFAIIFTIQYQYSLDASKSIPFLEINTKSKDDNKQMFYAYISYSNSKLTIGPTIFEYTIENNSEFLAKNVEIKLIESFSQPSYQTPSLKVRRENRIENDMENFTELFPKGHSITNFIFLEHTIESENLDFNLEILVEYEDTFNQNKYQKIIVFRFYKDSRKIEKNYLSLNNLIKDVNDRKFHQVPYVVLKIKDVTKKINV